MKGGHNKIGRSLFALLGIWKWSSERTYGASLFILLRFKERRTERARKKARTLGPTTVSPFSFTLPKLMDVVKSAAGGAWDQLQSNGFHLEETQRKSASVSVLQPLQQQFMDHLLAWASKWKLTEDWNPSKGEPWQSRMLRFSQRPGPDWSLPLRFSWDFWLSSFPPLTATEEDRFLPPVFVTELICSRE